MKILWATLVLSVVAPIQVAQSRNPEQDHGYDARHYAGILPLATEIEYASISSAPAPGYEQTKDDGQPVRVVSMPAKDRLDRFALYVNGGLFCVGAAGVLIALITWSTLRRSSERQLRAYVFPTDIYMTDGTTLTPPEPHRANIPGVALIFRNTGQTPAYKVCSWAAIVVTPVQNESQLTVPPTENVSRHPLGAGATSNKALWYDRVLNPAEIAEIAQGTRGIYLHGRIEYEDTFGKARWVNFRLVFTGKIFPPVAPNASFTYCNSGNDAN